MKESNVKEAVKKIDTIKVKIGENKNAIVFKNSNVFEVEGERFYLTQIVWDKVTDEVAKEIIELTK